jgi:AmmeMemoRadiSam system protein B/AmmeMemoRadiSam system protein A
MKPSFLLSGALCLSICLNCFLPPAESIYAKGVRNAAKAGTWYPADSTRVQKDIDHLTRLARKTRVYIPANKKLKALILPHAGYAYSGWTAAHAVFLLPGKQFSKVILMGPDHYIGFRNGAISDVSAYETPLGTTKLHPHAATLRNGSNLFQAIPSSDRAEHSLEMVLLFLQSYIENLQIVPIVVGPTQIPQFADALEGIWDANSLLVVSSDLSHFLSYDNAVERDRETIRWITKLNATKLLKSENRACGSTPISVLIHLARRHQWQPVLLHYSNSGDTSGDRSRVVGYAAIAFFGDQHMQENTELNQHLNEEQGQVLVRLARQTIMEELGEAVPPHESESVKSSLSESCYQAHCGIFVTLKINGQLRGCIGSLTASEPLSDGVRTNAINAAFRDPRFSPLTEKELPKVEIEVSILSEPQPLEYSDADDLIKKLRVHIDGVIIRKGHASATFLPQVWEQLPAPEEFLSHLCMKAGLGSEAWRNTKIEVLTYQVQYFEEHK